MQILYSTWPPRSSRAGRPSMVQYKWSDALGKCSPGYPRFHSEELFITASRFPPHSSLIIHHSSFITHHSSLITHHSSSRSDRTKRSYLSLLLAPRFPLPASVLRPPSSVLRPQSSVLSPPPSVLRPRPSLLTAHGSLRSRCRFWFPLLVAVLHD
jgi:hypothetical protein